jgi:hypothetical protein
MKKFKPTKLAAVRKAPHIKTGSGKVKRAHISTGGGGKGTAIGKKVGKSVGKFVGSVGSMVADPNEG